MNKTSCLTLLLLASAALLLPSCAYHAPSKHVVHNHTVVKKPAVKKQVVVKRPTVVKQTVVKSPVYVTHQSVFKKPAASKRPAPLKQPHVSKKSSFSKYNRHAVTHKQGGVKKVVHKKIVTKRVVNNNRGNRNPSASHKKSRSSRSGQMASRY